MKAATGELNLTLITVIALGLLLTLFVSFMWPSIKDKLTAEWDEQESLNENIDVSMNEFTNYIETELF